MLNSDLILSKLVEKYPNFDVTKNIVRNVEDTYHIANTLISLFMPHISNEVIITKLNHYVIRIEFLNCFTYNASNEKEIFEILTQYFEN
jgi:thiamine phosphate synthase YjbQ (UPF0047 family)